MLGLGMTGLVSRRAAVPYAANAVNFDGTNDYLNKSGALNGIANGKIIVVNAWLQLKQLGRTHSILRDNAGFDFLFLINTNNKVYVEAWNGLSARLALTSSAALALNAWTHVFLYADLTDPAKRGLYINDGLDAATWSTYVNGDIDWIGATSFSVGGTFSGTVLARGDMADVWLSTSQWVNGGLEATRRKFISAAGKPVDLGADGSTPTGTAPTIFLSGATATWHTNLGTGGGFTETGELTAGQLPVQLAA